MNNNTPRVPPMPPGIGNVARPPASPQQVQVPHGAIDLNTLRQPPPQVKTNAINGLLQQAGLVCSCGALIEHGGVELVVLVEGMQMTPQGPAKGVSVDKRAFCGQECAHFQNMTQAALQTPNVLIIAIQPAPERVWLKRPEPTS